MSEVIEMNIFKWPLIESDKGRTLPYTRGVYAFIGDRQGVFYIGRTWQLCERLNPHNHKIMVALRRARVYYQIAYLITDADIRPIERCLIKKHRPTYNRQSKDTQAAIRADESAELAYWDLGLI